MEGLKVAVVAFNRPFHLCWSLAVGQINTIQNMSSAQLLRVDNVDLELASIQGVVP